MVYLVTIGIICGIILGKDFVTTINITPLIQNVLFALGTLVYFFVLYLFLWRCIYFIKNKGSFKIKMTKIHSKISHNLGLLLMVLGLISIVFDFFHSFYNFYSKISKSMDWTFIGYSLKYFIIGVLLFEFGRYMQIEKNNKDT
jgi:hypothetical protein